MISPITFHPFFAHFPPALFVAGALLLILAKKRNHSGLAAAASLNFSLGLLLAVLADFSGLVSADMSARTSAQVENHLSYSFLFTAFYVISTIFSYTKTFSRTAVIFYILNFAALCASIYSGYLLVFHSMG